jgi:hypothetical protein
LRPVGDNVLLCAILSEFLLFKDLKREYSVIAVVFFKFIIKIIKFISSCLVFQRRHLSKPKPKVEMGTQNSDIDYDWIPKQALQSKNDKRNKIKFDR